MESNVGGIGEWDLPVSARVTSDQLFVAEELLWEIVDVKTHFQDEKKTEKKRKDPC